MDTAPSSGSLDVGSGADRRSIQYLTRAGNAPGVFWMSGFKSEMRSTKASYLDEWAARRGQAYTRFDYSGHGLSAGRFEDGTLSRWLEEAIAVFDHLTEGPQVVVGSSMGGIPELVSDGETGLIFEAGDPEAAGREIARAIERAAPWLDCEARRPPP